MFSCFNDFAEHNFLFVTVSLVVAAADSDTYAIADVTRFDGVLMAGWRRINCSPSDLPGTNLAFLACLACLA